MVVVPAGSFMMGASPGEEEREDIPDTQRGNAQPQRRVTIAKPFALGRSHVKRGVYAAFAADTGRPTPDGCRVFQDNKWEAVPGSSWKTPGWEQTDRHPVVCVSWEDAKAYARWLSRKTGMPYRLPSEAEWEYAARAGTTTPRFWSESAHDGCDYANTADLTRAISLKLKQAPNTTTMCQDDHVHTAPSASYRANGFGLHDMLGNAWHWIEDCWKQGYEGAPDDGSAWTQEQCRNRVLRGGSWGSTPGSVRAPSRIAFGAGPGVRYHNAGFRVARSF